MGALKIGVYAICKNESQFVDKWVDAMQEADVIVVADTGSTDDTVEKLRARGVEVYEINVNPWRFDEARNKSLALLPADVDVCVAPDLDEVFDPGWRKQIEDNWEEGNQYMRHLWAISYHEDGSVDASCHHGKIHARKGYVWRYPVHEELVYTGEAPYKEVSNWDLILKHYPDNSKPRSQYMPLLELSRKEYPEHARNIYFLGWEYLQDRQYEACIEVMKEYLKLPNATWEPERSTAMRYIGRSYVALENKNEASRWYYRAIGESPDMREGYLDMAKLAYGEQDWPRVYHMVEEGLKITNRVKYYLSEEAPWGYMLYDYGTMACYHLGMKMQALTYAKAALARASEIERLAYNVAFLEEDQE